MTNNSSDSRELVFRNGTLLAVMQDAAVAAYTTRGRCDKHGADEAATAAMRESFNRLMSATSTAAEVVIGEGERDEAPMLYIGERLGSEQGEITYDIAVDPLENTNACASDQPGAITVAAYAVRGEGRLMGGPDGYLLKFAGSPDFHKAWLDYRQTKKRPSGYVGNLDPDCMVLEQPPAEILRFAAVALNRPIESFRVEMLDRERNRYLQEQILATGAGVSLIKDGDILSVVKVGDDDHSLDFLLGIGAAAEGVIAAAIARSMGCYLEAQVAIDHVDVKDRNADLQRFVAGGFQENRVYDAAELAQGSVGFAMSAVTDAGPLKGVRLSPNGEYLYIDSMYGRSRKQAPHIDRTRRLVIG